MRCVYDLTTWGCSRPSLGPWKTKSFARRDFLPSGSGRMQGEMNELAKAEEVGITTRLFMDGQRLCLDSAFLIWIGVSISSAWP